MFSTWKRHEWNISSKRSVSPLHSLQHHQKWFTRDPLPSEIENYCCRESTCLLDSILEAKGIPCVTEYQLFKTAIGNQEVLELCAFGMDQRKLPVYKNGKIKPEGLRFTAYKNFLNMCGIRWIGKHRRYALPACVIGEIRRLYPSGQYTAFKESQFSSRLE